MTEDRLSGRPDTPPGRGLMQGLEEMRPVGVWRRVGSRRNTNVVDPHFTVLAKIRQSILAPSKKR